MHFSYQGIKAFCMLSCELTLNSNSSLKLSLFKLLVVLLSLCVLTLNRLEGGGEWDFTSLQFFRKCAF